MFESAQKKNHFLGIKWDCADGICEWLAILEGQTTSWVARKRNMV